MKTITLKVEDSKVDLVLSIIDSLKNNIITKYEVINDEIEHRDYIKLSEHSLESIWNNNEDSVYDKFLQV